MNVPSSYKNRDSKDRLQNAASWWLQAWLLVKLQVEAPPEELQQLQGGFSFSSFKKIEANFDGWSEATLEATMKPHFEAYSDCP